MTASNINKKNYHEVWFSLTRLIDPSILNSRHTQFDLFTRLAQYDRLNWHDLSSSEIEQNKKTKVMSGYVHDVDNEWLR